MILNITSGEILNDMIKKDGEEWIPFNEAMIKGNYSYEPFTEEFIKERSKVHNVSIKNYKKNMVLFLESIKKINTYKEINLYFGSEPFCSENIKFLLKTLDYYNYKGTIILHTVNEDNGDILSITNIK